MNIRVRATRGIIIAAAILLGAFLLSAFIPAPLVTDDPDYDNVYTTIGPFVFTNLPVLNFNIFWIIAFLLLSGLVVFALASGRSRMFLASVLCLSGVFILACFLTFMADETADAISFLTRNVWTIQLSPFFVAAGFIMLTFTADTGISLMLLALVGLFVVSLIWRDRERRYNRRMNLKISQPAFLQ